ncbi:GntR family transcriptional regulator [Paramicrobacterium fandaimingii]|uniref:GntR family transcriptional regulator n=1 Tax=Paramicrobacterium fandaimingii TaxID=2708079 RepID=UPI00141FA25E|nr:GntR family transcriptional regulator [Microbacterium fandaimingii]
MALIDEFLAEPLTTTVGQPLRVAAYTRITQGIRDGVFPLGSALPRETELGTSLGVSRTVIREALMLLEEDGLITTRRGVGRFVAASAPKVGLEDLRPFEVALANAEHPVTVKPTTFVMQPNTEFVSSNLGLDPEANTWFRESVLSRADEPIAIVQEHLPAGRYLSDISPAIAASFQQAAEQNATLFAGLLEACGSIFSASSCQITPSVVGASRGKQLGLAASDPVIILTQVVEHNATPVYLAKCIVSSRVGHLTVIQTPSN